MRWSATTCGGPPQHAVVRHNMRWSATTCGGPLQHAVVRHNMLYDITAPQPSLLQVSSIDDVFLGHFHLRFLPSKHVPLLL
jgi:hypothetical protein